MKSILVLIQKHQSGEPTATTEILNRMIPLVKKYASKIHCMEYDDALQEFNITLLETLPYLKPSKGEWKCLKYMETAVINRYYALCKYYLSIPKTDDIEACSVSLIAPPAFDDTYYDIVNYINSLPKQGMKNKIISMFFYEDMNDTEIAAVLNVSRQYVNRIKKQLIKDYFQTRE